MLENFDVASFVETCVLLALLGWLIYGAAQMAAVWTQAKSSIAALKDEQARNAKALFKDLKEIDRLNGEIKEARSGIEAAVQSAGAKRAALAAFVPPPPREIYVTSEFPFSKKSRAWVVNLKLSDTSRATRAEKEAGRQLLVWAPDYVSAGHFAPRFLPRKEYEIDKISLLDPS